MADELLYLFGGDHPWDSSLWTASDDRVRGGSSISHLTALSPERAEFHGHLDTQTLGGAGFASQRTLDELSLDLSAYAGLLIAVDEADGKKYTLTLKDTLPDKRRRPGDDDDDDDDDDDGDDGDDGDGGRDRAGVSWEVDFVPRRAGEDVLVRWADFRATYRGRDVQGERLDLGSVKRVGLMMRSFFGEQEGGFRLVVHCIAAKRSFEEEEEEEEEGLKAGVAVRDVPRRAWWRRLLCGLA